MFLGAQGAIRAPCFQFVKGPEFPVTEGTASVKVAAASAITHKNAGERHCLSAVCPFRDIGNRTFRRHRLHFSARRGRRGDAMEGAFCDGRTNAVCGPTEGRRDDGFAWTGVRYLAKDRV